MGVCLLPPQHREVSVTQVSHSSEDKHSRHHSERLTSRIDGNIYKECST